MKKQTISGLFKMTLTAGFVLAFLFIPTGAFAASLIHWNDGDTYVSIEDGETYSIPIGVEGDVYISTDEPVFSIEGTVFFLQNPNDSNSREYIDTIFASFPEFPDLFTWPQAGVYEIDVYESAPPVLSSKSWFEKLVRIIFGSNVYAQDPNLYLGTIHFTIEDSNAPQYQECCSSVIFLPGFEGSVLKAEGGTNTLWPPDLLGTDSDLNALRLDQNGDSITPNVTVEGIVEKFHGVSVYDGFESFMNTLVPGTITHWEAFPYDWRFPPSEAIANEDMIARLEDIALNHSMTGQVNLVGHSNGGLVGKALIRQLEEQGKASLIDSFVMVGTPQLGTPQAIGGLLHGEGASLGNWFFTLVSKAEARALAHNMESVYDLLPSREYFNHVTDPTVLFDEGAGYTDPWREIWGLAAGNFNELFEFLTDETNTRIEPAYSDIRSPSILRSDLLTNADVFHQTIDVYDIPDSVRVVQVAGWGLDTIKGIGYTSFDHLISSLPYYIPLTTIEGDSTVVFPSALSSEGEKYYFNLQEYIKDGNPFVEHINILNSDVTQGIVKSTIDGDSIPLSSFLVMEKPLATDSDDELLVSVHSPLTLGVYDDQGRFTGVDQNNDPSWGIQFIKKEIPNSTYLQFGEGKYLYVPQNGNYEFTFEGTGRGRAIVIVKDVIANVPSTSATFSNIWVTPRTDITLDLNENTEVPTLIIDRNGDGEVDITLFPDGYEEEQTGGTGDTGDTSEPDDSGSVDTGEYYINSDRYWRQL